MRPLHSSDVPGFRLGTDYISIFLCQLRRLCDATSQRVRGKMVLLVGGLTCAQQAATRSPPVTSRHYVSPRFRVTE